MGQSETKTKDALVAISHAVPQPQTTKPPRATHATKEQSVCRYPLARLALLAGDNRGCNQLFKRAREHLLRVPKQHELGQMLCVKMRLPRLLWSRHRRRRR